jgi:hypothetical protein
MHFSVRKERDTLTHDNIRRHIMLYCLPNRAHLNIIKSTWDIRKYRAGWKHSNAVEALKVIIRFDQ